MRQKPKFRKNQALLSASAIKKDVVDSIAKKQQEHHESERLRLVKYIRKDECHAHLATRIYTYKYSFAPCKTYAQVAEELGCITGQYLNAVTLRVKNLSHKQFMLVHEALRRLEIELGLPEQPQGFWEE